DRLAPRSQYPMNLVHDMLGVRGVVDDPVAVDQIEAAVLERQPLGVLMDERAGETAQPEILLRVSEVACGEIDVRDDRARLGELRKVGAQPAADLQQRFSRMAIELH